MGNLTSRQNIGVEEVDIASNHAYKYPPRSGNYFGSHFIMGGERFDTPQPEAYLFGENVDLNFLGNRPTPFPYPPPQANEPTKTLKSLVNIRKESVRFVKTPDSVLKTHFPQDESKENKFNIEFILDCDSRCAITIYYFCTEEVTNTGLVYTSKFPSMNSETFHLKRGANQLFSQPTHVFDPSKFTDDELTYDLEKEIIPIAIHCLAEEGVEGEPRQSHTTFAVVDRHADSSYVLRALKQKLYVDGLCYLLQEIYGIENKNNENTKTVNEDETEDNSAECVICMCDVRDTLILPCRHLCLCNSCADSLRYQANNCPICRAPFRALLQIRALHKFSNCVSNPMHHDATCDQIPPGYEAVSLVEALNGPYTAHAPTLVLDMADSPSSEATVQAAEMLNRQSSIDDGKGSPGESKGEYRLSMILQREDSCKRRLGSKTSLRETERRSRETPEEEREEEKVATEPDQTVDVDSDVEKLSPLLVIKKSEPISAPEGVPSPVNDTDKKTKDEGVGCADDSDYYTPDEPHPSTLSPLYESDKDVVVTSPESTPDRQVQTISLPGTPLSANSHVSVRSSADSYSSSSSTRHLLTHNLAVKSEKNAGARQVKD